MLTLLEFIMDIVVYPGTDWLDFNIWENWRLLQWLWDGTSQYNSIYSGCCPSYNARSRAARKQHDPTSTASG